MTDAELDSEIKRYDLAVAKAKAFRWRYIEHGDDTLHPVDKMYFDQATLMCSYCETCVSDHRPQPAELELTLSIKVSSYKAAGELAREAYPHDAEVIKTEVLPQE